MKKNLNTYHPIQLLIDTGAAVGQTYCQECDQCFRLYFRMTAEKSKYVREKKLFLCTFDFQWI